MNNTPLEKYGRVTRHVLANTMPYQLRLEDEDCQPILRKLSQVAQLASSPGPSGGGEEPGDEASVETRGRGLAAVLPSVFME